jgi:hypothetical protein
MSHQCLHGRNGSSRFAPTESRDMGAEWAATPPICGLCFPCLQLGLGTGSFSGGRYRQGSGSAPGFGIGTLPGGSSYELAPCIVTFEVRHGQDFRRRPIS